MTIQPPQGGGARAGRGRRRLRAAQSEKLGDGVYLITGGYAVIAVDFKDYIALIESGQNEAARAGRHRRSQAADSRTSRSST